VKAFLSDCSTKEIKFGSDERGWMTRQIFVRLNTVEDFEIACRKDNKQLRWQQVGVIAVDKDKFYKTLGEANYNDQPSSENVIDKEKSYFIRLRGLPYSASGTDILTFLNDVNVKNDEKGIHFSFGVDGRVSGEAYVEVCAPDDVERALKHYREHLGGRYIEIFVASRDQFEWDCQRGHNGGGGSGGVVRLRGLPYGCSKEDIRDFFQGLVFGWVVSLLLFLLLVVYCLLLLFVLGIGISENRITIQTNGNGRETGEAFVELENEGDVEAALERHRKTMGHRYIEVFRTTQNDIRPIADRWSKYARPSPYTNPRGSTHGYDSPPSNPHHRGAGYKFGSTNSNSYSNTMQQYGGSHQYQRDLGMTAPPNTYDNSGGSHSVWMRGLPYSATEQDIYYFFAPLVPLRIIIEKDALGRPSGQGEVIFHTPEDASSAMRKDKSHIGTYTHTSYTLCNCWVVNWEGRAYLRRSFITHN
jgi:heterogeneous nuclear ribonucleoprotein F/H